MESRRQVLQNVVHTKSTNPALWLHRWLPSQHQGGEGAYRALVDQVARLSAEFPLYAAFYDRWKEGLELYGAETAEAETRGRLVVGLGGDGVIETGITLHHTYGVPLIPGSALKGLAAAYAHQYLAGEAWRKGGDAHQIVFGRMESAGYVTFHDALLIPDSRGQTLHADVMAIHHAKYYRGDAAPADWDDPTIVPFLSATGRFLVALSGPEEWVQAAFKILKLALDRLGVGAKTSSGYGRLTLKPPEPKPIQKKPKKPKVSAPDPCREQVEAFIKSHDYKAVNIGRDEWRSSTLPERCREQMARALLQKYKPTNAGKRRSLLRNRTHWYHEVRATLPPDDTTCDW